MAHETWEAEKTRYQLHQGPNGVIVYRLKAEFVIAGELLHHICPRCYEARKKSLLQPRVRRGPITVCPTCETEFRCHIQDLSDS